MSSICSMCVWHRVTTSTYTGGTDRRASQPPAPAPAPAPAPPAADISGKPSVAPNEDDRRLRSASNRDRRRMKCVVRLRVAPIDLFLPAAVAMVACAVWNARTAWSIAWVPANTPPHKTHPTSTQAGVHRRRRWRPPDYLLHNIRTHTYTLGAAGGELSNNSPRNSARCLNAVT